VVTANVPEAETLAGIVVDSVDAMERAAAALVRSGARYALVKGGHLSGPAIDVLADEDGCRRLEAPRIQTPHTHGTGCTLAAAIAAALALKTPVPQAVEGAKRYVTWAIRHAPGLGSGHGPLAWRAAGLPQESD
jgi:hydroxymethylpyrimidine/phosphomethylpyrimidine kinase